MNPKENNNDVLVKMEGVSRRFSVDGSKVAALDNVDLTIIQGEIIGVIGSSGAGKSTLLHVLGGLDKPTSGCVLYDGKNIFQMNDADLAHFRSKRIGFVFQAHHLLPEFTAEENVALPAMIAGLSKKEALKKGRHLLASMGLEGRFKHRPGKLSGGEQQRVAIARALVNDPDLVLADEPTGNLDSKTGMEIFELLLSLNARKGQTFVFVTHNLELAKRMSRIIKIKDGKFVYSPDDMLE